MSLFNELKRRNVFRVGLAYLVSAWVIAQVADLVLDNIDAPVWVMQALLLVLGLGFIIALVISWAYELTPEGLKKDRDVPVNESIARHTAKKLDYITLAGVLLVVALFAYQQMNPPVQINTSEQDSEIEVANSDSRLLGNDENVEDDKSVKSIAVLPFADMSQAGDQEYFADGISEEILNVLVRIPKLKVAGRTSSFSFKGKNQDLRIIGESLGVNHILEGSVRRSNTTLRITAQLIRSDDGFHLWSETYDREMADIFDIQDEIANQVAEQMVISMGLEVKTSKQNRTADIEVYEDYLKARQLFLKRGKDNIDAALDLINQATARDPNYAPAWTLKAQSYIVYWAYANNQEQRSRYNEWNQLSKEAAQRALALDNNSGEAHAALGGAYFNEFNLIKGFESYEQALSLTPDSAVILDSFAQDLLLVGYFEKAKEYAEQAIAIDPLVAVYRITLANANYSLKLFNEAIKSFEKSIALDPKLEWSYNNLQIHYLKSKNYEAYRKIIELRRSNGVPDNDYVIQSLAFINDTNLINNATVDSIKNITGWNKYFLVITLKHADSYILHSDRAQWSAEFRTRLKFFANDAPNLYDHPRWREQIRKDGVLALWQAKGFPSQCKAVGEDDFECVLPNGTNL